MKTKFITLLALSGCMCACSSSEHTGDNTDVTPLNAVSIRLDQPSVGESSRAVVEDGNSMTAKMVMCDGAAADWSTFAPVYANIIDADKILTQRANITDVTFVANSTTAKEVTLSTLFYYDNKITTNKAWLTAVYPSGTFQNGTIVFATKDGEQDVMVASNVNAGTHDLPSATVALSFAHKTSQLSFGVKLKPHDPAINGAWQGKAISIKSVNLQAAQLPSSYNISQNAVVWNDPALLAIPGIQNTTVAQEVAKIGRPIMVNASNNLFVNAVITVDGTDITFNNIPILDAVTPTSRLQTEIGKSHQITITVVEPSIANEATPIVFVEALVQPWIEGTEGSVTLE